MVPEHVAAQQIPAAEGLGAQVAGVGPLVGVAVLVVAQAVLTREGQGAGAAPEGPLPRVRAHVALQVGVRPKALRAAVALEGAGRIGLGGSTAGHSPLFLGSYLGKT